MGLRGASANFKTPCPQLTGGRREGLAAGIVSRTLRLRQANSLLKIKRYEEAEELFKGLLDEKDYVKRANEGLAKIARMGPSAD